VKERLIPSVKPLARSYLTVAENLAAQVSTRNMHTELTPLVQISF
jgi:hypothetical protein